MEALKDSFYELLDLKKEAKKFKHEDVEIKG